MADPAKTGGRMLQSHQATQGDRAQYHASIERGGQIALSGAAMIAETIRQQQEMSQKAAVTRARMAEIHLKQQHAQKMLENFGVIQDLKLRKAAADEAALALAERRHMLNEQMVEDRRWDRTAGLYYDKQGQAWTQDPRSAEYSVAGKEQEEHALSLGSRGATKIDAVGKAMEGLSKRSAEFPGLPEDPKKMAERAIIEGIFTRKEFNDAVIRVAKKKWGINKPMKGFTDRKDVILEAIAELLKR